MSWTTTFSTGQVVTANELNTLVPQSAQAVPGGAVDVIYQNTTGKIRFAEMIVSLGSSAGGATVAGVIVKSASTTPPATQVGSYRTSVAIPAGQFLTTTITFCIPPNYYYTASSEGNISGFQISTLDLF